MTAWARIALFAAAAALTQVACDETRPGPDEAMPGQAVDPDAAAAPVNVVEATADSAAARLDEMPADTTATAVMALLEGAEYRESWTHWPGREAFYEGTDPHGHLLSTWLNARAARGLDALRSDEDDVLPEGSVIVKENFMPDSTLAAITVMYKAAEGYDPSNHDWFWLKFTAEADLSPAPGGDVEAAGRVESCIACHSEAAATTDYLMTARAEGDDGSDT
jgi:hypothetical protein